MRVFADQPVYEFSEFCLDPARRLLMRNGEPVDLHSKTFDLLLALVENSDRVLSKNELLNLVWEGQFVEENNLSVQMVALRKILGERKGEHKFIVTVPGRGYRWVSSVDYREHFVAKPSVIEAVKSNGSAEASIEISAARTDAKRSLRLYRFLWICLAVLLVGAASAMLLRSGAGNFGTFLRPAKDRSATPVFQVASARRVTNTGKVRTATLSPDGKMILYSSGKAGETGLWLGHVDGGEHIQLRPPGDAKYRGLAFAPDGKSVYYVVAEEQVVNGALYRSSILGGVPEKLRDIVNTQIAIAPDGLQFAYVRADPKANLSSLVVAELSGRNERVIASRPIDQPFEWLTPCWSPDGKQISIAAALGKFEGVEIFAIAVEDGSVKQLTSDGTWDEVRATEWLKDGAGILAIASERDSWADSQLYHISYPDGVVLHLNPDLIAYGPSLKVSSDNGTLLTNQVQRNSNIWVAPADDLTKGKQITFGSFERLDGLLDLTWTPDGKLIHSAMVGRAVTIWKTDPLVGKQQQVTPSSSSNYRASLTDDGRFLIFESNRSGSPEIWRSNVNGEDARQLTSGGENSWPHVSPDGHWIAFRKRDGFLWRTTIDGTDEIRLTDRSASKPRFSPDSKYIAGIFETDDGKQQVSVMQIDGGPPIRRFDVPRNANLNLGVRWTPDGKAFTYRDWIQGIWRQDINGGPPERLPGLPKEARYAYDWSRDGKSFAFVPGQWISDVVLLSSSK